MGNELWESLQRLSGLGVQQMADIGIVPMLVLLAISLLSSLFIAYLYRVFYASRATGSQVHRAFPLMGVSITAIFVTIQFSLPLSLGLLGALSIVRFRTPIKEPEEIGFILVVIATSLSAATFNLAFLGIVLVVVVVALLLMRTVPALLGRRGGDGTLVVTLPAAERPDALAALLEYLGQALPRGELDSVAEDDRQVAISYRFKQLAAERIGDLQAGAKRISAAASTSAFFDRSHDL